MNDHDVDETTLKPEWANRPRIGDTVRGDTAPHFEGVVVATFYRNGEGGMHVRYSDDGKISWASCHRNEVVKKAESTNGC